MSRWRMRAQSLAAELERQFENRRLVAGPAGRAVIVPYRSFGRANELLVSGRVLAEKLITRAAEAEPVWRNVLNAYRRFQSDEVAGARVRATYGSLVTETVSDEEGHFQLRIAPETTIDPAARWHEVQLTLDDGDAPRVAHVLVPPAAADLMVISDIDDTIVQTGATSLLKMIDTTFLRNAATRLPFEGVAELYAALIRDVNPIFYVSSSPWNLYELLADFLDLNKIPHGPMLLQDFGIGEEKLIHAPHDVHKLEKIRLLLDYYDTLPAVLIGDSGQRDPEIYLQIIQAYPSRIRAAFIRDVTPDVRDQAVARIIEQAKEAGVEMLYVPDSRAALNHARRMELV